MEAKGMKTVVEPEEHGNYWAAADPSSTATVTVIDYPLYSHETRYTSALNLGNRAEIVIVTAEPAEEYLDRNWSPSSSRCYWPSVIRGGAFHPFALRFSADEEELGQPGDLVASESPWPVLWEREEPQPATWRGVFAPRYQPTPLFSKKLSVRTAELPAWKPRVTIGRRLLEAPGSDE
jgi:hypothetical protein